MAKASVIAAKEAQAQADQAAALKALQDTVAVLLESVTAIDAKIDQLIETSADAVSTQKPHKATKSEKA
jgi:hypothetical protein